MEVINHIEIREDQAYIRGTNKKAEMIARMYVGTSYNIEDVTEHYNLSASEVHAAIAYYYDNQDALDARHQQSIQWAEENALTLDKFKAKIAARNASDQD
ncbi:MAG: hypothetical protein WBC91_16680 [Phototrophicaceae bacterium]